MHTNAQNRPTTINRITNIRKHFYLTTPKPITAKVPNCTAVRHVATTINNKTTFISYKLDDDRHTGCSKKTDPLVYFDDNFGKYGPILTIFSLLQQDIYDTQK